MRSEALITLVLPTPPLLAKTLDWITGYHCSTNCRPVMLEMGMLTRPRYRCKRRLRMVGKLLNSKCSPQNTVSVRGLLVAGGADPGGLDTGV
ncbi:hypothetical protein EYF80_017466 [Liparis tanakae]|uniref:Uncharacterized protein n=1 Tax=Liparis tanakae TaxID=230148 RepID=A0A4Z2I4U5_9TELE|nr:hypothetical protein EYF80_017466 [Liparis tanakae]